MYNNESLLNKVLLDYKLNSFVDSSQTSFITPCEALNKYMNDPCSIFNKNIISIGPLPPIPPLPPMPPLPPGRQVIGEGLFLGIPGVFGIGSQLSVPFNSIIQGMGIAHNDGDPEIFLLPNTTYEFSYTIEINADIDIPESRSFIVIRGVLILDSEDLKINVPPGPVIYMRAGTFTTGDDPDQSMFLTVLNSVDSQLNLISATLRLEALS